MKQLLIIGAGGFGREVYWLARGIQDEDSKNQYDIKGFLDDRPDILAGYAYEHGIINTVENYTPEENDIFICAIGSPKEREIYSQKILAKGGAFTNLIHPTVALNPNIYWGKGIIIGPHASLSCDITVGDFVCINSYCAIGHDVSIGNYTQINSYTFIGGNAKIGAGVTIHPHAVVMPKIIIEDRAIVGAGSVALNKINADQTVFGLPAVPVKY